MSERALASLKINDIAHVKAALETWARRMHGSFGSVMSMTGKLMSGVRDNVCPLWLDDIANRKAHNSDCQLCQGKGRIKLDARKRIKVLACSICGPDGRFLGEPCFRCGGKKKYMDITILVNPAAIRGTGVSYGDVQSAIIEQLVGSWQAQDSTIWLHRVTVFQYCRLGTQKMKADRLGISLSFFERRLHEAHYYVERALDDDLPRSG